ncbi:hypothetical protein [Polymorphospora sp. NPDC050346]|uniref:hypothetical protein n=1 Tax=Polymorphospora sp. NPDC050346 TaxID=3155780 RepID=UPI0033C4A9E8
MATTYRVARQTARWCRFAAVSVDVGTASRHEVVGAPDGIHPYRLREAELGAWQALRALPAGSGPRQVIIRDIVASDADTNIGDIHEAAARAVWQAPDVDPRPAYAGFGDPELVDLWLRDRIGLRLTAVTEARHWYDGRRGPDADGLLHMWLHFERGAPTKLHGQGDELLLSVEEPYASYDMDEYGEVRVGSRAPDLLAGIVGARLDAAAVVLGPGDAPVCAGLRLRLGGAEITIATYGDEWTLARSDLPGKTDGRSS